MKSWARCVPCALGLFLMVTAPASASDPEELGEPIVAEEYDFRDGETPERARWRLLAQAGGGLRLADSGWPDDARYEYFGITTAGGMLGFSGRRRFDELWVLQLRFVLDYAPYSAQAVEQLPIRTGYYHALAYQLEVGALRQPLVDSRLFAGGGVLLGLRHFTGSFQRVPDDGASLSDAFAVMVLGITLEGGIYFDEAQQFEALLRVPVQVSGLSGGAMTEAGITVLFGARVF